MLHFRRTFDNEKGQLQELNSRLSQYLSRAKQLEQENARLIVEINSIRQDRPAQWEHQHMAELRQMRRMVEQLAFEKSKAEMEREKLRQEFHMVKALCSEETAVSKGIGGELKSWEKELHQAHNTNAALEARLIELENEYRFLEDAHSQEIAHMRSQAHSRIVPVVTQTYHGPPAPSMEEVELYARSLSESWVDTYDMYRIRVEEMEQSIKADQARLEDMGREKMQYVSELNKLRAELDRHGQIQIHLEDQLMNMQEKFRADVNQYQVIIDELEHERVMLADAMSGKLQDHQNLLKVKMDLGLEVAAYRALLEGEGRHAQMWSDHHSRERIIDIKMPSHPHTPKAMGRLDIRSPFQLTGIERYMEPITGVRTATLSKTESKSASRVVPISVSARAHQSPAGRRDMVAFTKASQAAATATAASARASKPSAPSVERKREVVQEKSVKVTEGSYDQMPASLSTEQKTVRVEPPLPKTFDSLEKQKDNKADLRGQGKMADGKDQNERSHTETKSTTSEKKVLDTALMEEIIENVMKPAGLGVDLSKPDSKMTYHVEKTEEDDGTTKTQIILESKVQEDVDLSQDSALEELLRRGVTTVSLEDIKGTSTGSMIQNLLGLGLKEGESMENKTVNIKIIEEPVEIPSDEEAEIVSNPEFFQTSSMSYQIEEVENVHQADKQPQMSGEAIKAPTKETEYERNGSVRIQESSTDMGTPYSTQDQESQEYFVSTPEDNLSEEEGGFGSYGHYGVVDDLSDERYYQEGAFPVKKHFSEDSDSFRDEPEEIYEENVRSYVRDNIPECIIEEEVRVSPMVQESVLGILKEETLDPKEQLKGALEKLQGTMSGPLKEELSRLTQAELQGADNVSVDIKQVQQRSDNGTTTIVAELNVTQSLENSGLLGEESDDMSEEQIMAALRSNPELQKAFSGGAQGGYTMKVSKQEVTTQGMPWATERGEARDEEDIISGISKTERHIKLGPNETTFTFQMDANSGLAGAGGIDIQGLLQREEAGDDEITGAYGPKLKVSQEKKVATVFLDSTEQD
ncbi:synemin [Alosa sapidissima]|uniref:synemin n=1 Tax=Alosa sapidissima TaxID=34773 RepID=UPI001C0869C2|nr:synemin [Alosa sapidissima]